MHAVRLQPMVISAATGALALALPVAFHAVGLGSQFLPMLLPLLLNGFLTPLPWAAGTALAVPLLSAAATGMPPLYPPVALVVAGEALVTASIASLFRRPARRNVWAVLIPAIAAGRATAFGLLWLLARAFSLPEPLVASAALLHGLPGVALQLAVIPPVLRFLCRRGGILFTDGP